MLILLILAAACFLLAGFGFVLKHGNHVFDITALGLLFWVLVPLIERARS